MAAAGGFLMYVYRPILAGGQTIFEVGFFHPGSGAFESDWSTDDKEVAAARVSYLNGGMHPERHRTFVEADKSFRDYFQRAGINVPGAGS